MTPSPRFDPFLALLVVAAVAVAAALSPASGILPAVTAAHSAVAAQTAAEVAEATEATEATDATDATEAPDMTEAFAAPAAADAIATPTGWRPPVEGTLDVTRPFVAPASPYGPGHRGVDLAAPPQSRVLAAAAGEVSFAGRVAGRGVVVVAHDDLLRTTYEPVTAAVEAGDRVTTGQLLGLVEPGHPGCPATGCLHWGLRHGDTYLDPLNLIAPPAARLLPLG